VSTPSLAAEVRTLAVPSRPRELESIQALRAIAATSVIFDHIRFMGWGAFGVDIFFVVSGFIICYISSISSRDFLPKRVFRIVPLYWMGTFGGFLVALLVPHLLNSTTPDLHNLLKSLFFIPYLKENGTITPVLFLGWTLEYEVFFYLVFAAALAWSAKKAPMLATSLLAVVALAGYLLRPSSVLLAYYSDPIILEFTFGAAAFLLWRKFARTFENTPMIVALVVAVLSYVALFLLDVKAIGTPGSLLAGPRFLQRGIPAFLIFASFLCLEGKIRFPGWVLAIGDASYSLYLFHPYVVQVVDKKIVALDHITAFTVLASVLAILVCFLVALLSFRLFERPSNEFLRKMFLKPRSKTGQADRSDGLYRRSEVGAG